MATIALTVGSTSLGLSGNASPDAFTAPSTGVANLSTAQTGNGASTNIVDRGGAVGPVLLQLTTAIGATPTCTYTVEGSADGTNFFPVQYADSATPQTLVVSTFVITTTVTVFKLIPASIPVRYLRVSYSSNTNVTNTLDAYIW